MSVWKQGTSQPLSVQHKSYWGNGESNVTAFIHQIQACDANLNRIVLCSLVLFNNITYVVLDA